MRMEIVCLTLGPLQKLEVHFAGCEISFVISLEKQRDLLPFLVSSAMVYILSGYFRRRPVDTEVLQSVFWAISNLEV